MTGVPRTGPPGERGRTGRRPAGTRFAIEGREGSRVVVEGGRLVAPEGRADATFRIADGWIRPGLLNAHDHFAFNHFPRLGAPPYPNLYAWAEDVHRRFAEPVARCRELPRAHALLFSALKNLLGGVTRAVHHDPWAPDLEALPVRVEPVRVVHSLGLVPEGGRGGARWPGEAPPWTGGPAPAGAGRTPPLCMHLAEGVDEVARAEVLRARELGLLGPDLLAVHLVGVDPEGARLVAESGAAFVWCPSSSRHLYGRAAPAELFGHGLDVLLGTDSLLSGEGTLLHELAVAHGEGHLGPAALEAAVGATCARRLGLPDPDLGPGSPADLVVLSRPLLEARPADVLLVLVGGLPRYGEPELAELFRRTGVASERLEVGGRPKLVEAPLASVAAEVFRLSPECRRIVA